MDYAGIAYRTVEVDPLFKEEIKFSKDYKKVCMYVYMHTYINIYTHTYVYLCVCIDIYI